MKIKQYNYDLLGNFSPKKVFNNREYTSGLSARFNRWLWNQNKHKIDAELPAAREEQNWSSELTPLFCVRHIFSNI